MRPDPLGETKTHWADIGACEDFEPDRIHEFSFGARRIGVVRFDDEWYAFKTICPHLGDSLKRGKVERVGGEVTVRCPSHGWLFSLTSGDQVAMSAPSHLTVYPIRVVDGRVQVGVYTTRQF